jgi:predicted ATPase
MHRNENLFILAGTSGTGKTALLNELQARGYSTHSEVTRAVLEDQVACDGDALPSINPALFIHTLLLDSIERFDASIDAAKPVFFDRGIPDLIAYAARFNVDDSAIRAAGNRYRYNATCFLLPPWKTIFKNDKFRGGTFEFYEAFHLSLMQGYRDLGYRFVELPLVSITARADHILDHIKRH